MHRRHSTDSSSDEYAPTDDSSCDEHAPTDTETDQYSSLDTKLTDVDDDIDEVNLVKVDRSNYIEDAKEVEAIDCAFLPTDEVHPPEY